MEINKDNIQEWAEFGKSYASDNLRQLIFVKYRLSTGFYDLIGTRNAHPMAYQDFSEFICQYRVMRNKYLKMGLDVQSFDEHIASSTRNSEILPIKSLMSPLTEEETLLQDNKFKELTVKIKQP